MVEAPNVRLRVVQLDGEHLESWLEIRHDRFCHGLFPTLMEGNSPTISLGGRNVSVVNRGHPRLSSNPSLREFAAENHVLVSTLGTGHAHKLAERAVEAAIPAQNIICRVPIFIAAAVIAKHTNAIATLPMSIAAVLLKISIWKSSDRHQKCQRSKSFNIGTIAFIASPATNRFAQCSQIFSACREPAHAIDLALSPKLSVVGADTAYNVCYWHKPIQLRPLLDQSGHDMSHHVNL